MARLARLVAVGAALASSLVFAGAAPAPAASTLNVYTLGDSVMAAFNYSSTARSVITTAYPNAVIDALECRRLIAPSCTTAAQPTPAPTALQVFVAKRGQLGDTVVIGTGYNDAGLGAGTIDTIMSELTTHGVPRVIWLTYKNSGAYAGVYSGSNASLAAATARWPQLRIGDWNATSVGHPEWFANGTDVHLTASGAVAYATFIKNELDAVGYVRIACPPSDNQPGASGPAGRGYWMLDSSGRIHGFGSAGDVAPNLGDLSTIGDTSPPSSLQSTPSGEGYWIVDQKGKVNAFGDAVFYGDMTGQVLNGPVLRLEPNPVGGGYWLVASDGGVFTFGPSTAFHGSTGSMRLNAPVLSMTATVTGNGYWLVAGDGGVFTFGDGVFHGSTGSMRLNAPVIAMAVPPDGSGYWLYASDGGVFSFDVQFYGSHPELGPCGDPAVSMRSTRTGKGYWLATRYGRVYGFGDAPTFGDQPVLAAGVTIIDMAVRD